MQKIKIKERKKIKEWKRDWGQRGEEDHFRRTRKGTFKYLKVTMLMGQGWSMRGSKHMSLVVTRGRKSTHQESSKCEEDLPAWDGWQHKTGNKSQINSRIGTALCSNARIRGTSLQNEIISNRGQQNSTKTLKKHNTWVHDLNKSLQQDCWPKCYDSNNIQGKTVIVKFCHLDRI